MTGKVTWTIRDFSDEKTRFSVYIEDITPANLAAKLTEISALDVAVAALTVGNIVGVNLNIDTGDAGADTRPSSARAQRELGVKFFYQDDVTGKKYNFTVGAVDTNVVAQGGTDLVDLTGSLVAPIVTAFEALSVSEAGNPITINSAKIVGRRS